MTWIYPKNSDSIFNNSSSVVAPRLRATGLPYIASPEIMSSGNAQHIGTEYNRFIIIIQVHKFGVTTATRHGGTSRAATLSTLFMSHLKASIRSTNNSTAAERRGDGTPIHGDTAGTRPSSHSTS